MYDDPASVLGIGCGGKACAAKQGRGARSYKGGLHLTLHCTLHHILHCALHCTLPCCYFKLLLLV